VDKLKNAVLTQLLALLMSMGLFALAAHGQIVDKLGATCPQPLIHNP
jgi:hypothetical protein